MVWDPGSPVVASSSQSQLGQGQSSNKHTHAQSNREPKVIYDHWRIRPLHEWNACSRPNTSSPDGPLPLNQLDCLLFLFQIATHLQDPGPNGHVQCPSVWPQHAAVTPTRAMLIKQTSNTQFRLHSSLIKFSPDSRPTSVSSCTGQDVTVLINRNILIKTFTKKKNCCIQIGVQVGVVRSQTC